MEDRGIRAALDRHWAASDANDLEGEHQMSAPAIAALLLPATPRSFAPSAVAAADAPSRTLLV
jgi:hypothetical protein